MAAPRCRPANPSTPARRIAQLYAQHQKGASKAGAIAEFVEKFVAFDSSRRPARPSRRAPRTPAPLTGARLARLRLCPQVRQVILARCLGIQIIYSPIG